MQSLNTRLAQALNQLLGRAGTLFADHYHSHLLGTPTEVRRALEYVRTNAQKHYGREIEEDYFSSDHAGWRDLLAAPVTWLLTAGWRLVSQPVAGRGAKHRRSFLRRGRL